MTATTADLAAIRNPDCTECPLHANAKTVCMMGTGPLDARVALVGQSPGSEEDDQGVPFVGASGQLLDSLLDQVGLDRRSFFVTNTNRCHPPGNRPAEPAEIKACRPYLQQELDLVNPEIVVLLGNSALKGALGQSGILSKRGIAVEKDGRTYYPMLHPAFVLRSPNYLDSFKSDAERLKRLIEGTNEKPETEFHYVRTAGDVGDLVERMHLHPTDRPISLDVETATTTGRKDGAVQHWAPDWRLDSISFTFEPGESWPMALEHPEADWSDVPGGLPAVYEAINKGLRGKRLVGHNVKFELQSLRMRGIDVDAFADTMVMHQLLDENEQHGLKYLAKKYLGADAYEQEVNYGGGTPLEVLLPYNGRDTDYTLRLYWIFRSQLIEQPRLARIFRFISMPAVNALAEVELRGFPVDARRLKDRHEKIGEALAYLDEQMSAYVPAHLVKTRNWNPSKFLRFLLFHTLGLPVVSMTPKSKVEQLNDDVMQALRNYHPIMPMLIEWRKLHKWESTYTKKWIGLVKLVDEPRLHPSYNVTGTVTGRLSSNFQQVPRDPFIRGIIGAPPGYKIIEADFSQIELRVAAMVSMDPTMIELYREGADLHMFMAQAITLKPADQVTKEERSRAKPVSFGFLYGMGWRKFIPYALSEYGVVVSESEAQRYRTTFFERFPRLVVWHEKQRRMVEAVNYVESPIGRRRRLTDIQSSDKEVASEAGRQAINSPVQSFASDLCLMALGILATSDRLNQLDCKMLGQLHDSILFEVPDANAEESGSIIKETMETLPVAETFGYYMPVPIVADVAIVQHWGGK